MSSRPARRVLVAMVAAILLAGLVQASPATAAPPRLTSVTSVGQDWVNRSLKISWSWAKGHTYQVKYSHSSSFSGARSQDSTTNRGTWINSGISPGRTLYVTARAVTKDSRGVVTAAGPWSATLTTSLKPAAVGRFGSVRADPDPRGLRLSWSPVANASHYQVRWSAGADPRRTPDRWPNRWVPWFSAFNPTPRTALVQGTDATLTRAEYGNPIYAEVQAKNSHHSTSTVRASRQVVGWPEPAPVGPGAPVTVGSYNIECHTCGSRNWAQRRESVAQNIAKAAPDVVVLNEANATQDTDTAKRVNQIDPRRQWTVMHGGQYEFNTIMFDANKLELVKDPVLGDEGDGIFRVRHYGHSSPTAGSLVPYVRLRVKGTDSTFLVIGVHFEIPAGGTKASKKTRLGRNAEEVMTELETLNPGRRLPVVVAGDFNDYRNPEGRTDGPQARFVRDGDFYDASAAQRRYGTGFPTYNGYRPPSQQVEDPNKDGIRIDYILTQGVRGSERYQNVWNPGTKVVPSDHNLIVADLRIPATAPR